MSEANIKVTVLPDAAALADEAARRVVAAAERAIALSGTFSLVLAGGSTPKATYQLLAAEPYRSQVEWEKVEFYFGDERCVPPEHPDSNHRMAREALFDPLSIPAKNIHRIRAELDPQPAAIEYGQMLKARFGDGGADLVLLGMGDDGHTASLFPGTTALAESKHRCVAVHVEKLKAWRITLTAPFLNRAHQVMVLVSGAGKAARVAEVLQGPREPLRLPIQLIQPETGGLYWLMDAPAASMDHQTQAP